MPLTLNARMTGKLQIRS